MDGLRAHNQPMICAEPFDKLRAHMDGLRAA